MTTAKRANPAADISKDEADLNKKAAALYGIPANQAIAARREIGIEIGIRK